MTSVRRTASLSRALQGNQNARKKPKSHEKMRREKMCSRLLSARGWISCWFPIGMEETLNDDCTMNGIKAGPLKSAMLAIDDVLKMLGHVANGRVR